MADNWCNLAWVGKLGDTYNMLWKMVIRPPRDMYSPEELGPSKFRLGKRIYERRDLQLSSSRGKLECSHFFPAKSPQAKRPCVVYLHGNCSSRLEAFDALPVLLPRDITVFCLDLSGSGRSEGEYISLGHHEEKDLRVVLHYLRTQEHVGSIGLWGRSMGATTSILRAAEDHDLAACVLDSAFRDLKTVAEELVSRGRFPVPAFLLNWALEMIRSEVSSRAAFDPLELAPINSAPFAVCPAFFGVASDDTFVLPHHTQDLHSAWAGERVLRVFDGGHNGVRPAWFLEEAGDFLSDRLRAGGGFNDGCVIPIGEAINQKEVPVSSRSTDDAPKDDEESSGEDIDSTPTPRLVSLVTQQLQLEADSAAGPAVMSDMNLPKRKQHLAAELTKLGFSKEDTLRAMRECSTLEEALEWLGNHPSQALGAYEMGPPQGRIAPSECQDASEVVTPPSGVASGAGSMAAQSRVRQQAPRAAAPSKAPPRPPPPSPPPPPSYGSPLCPSASDWRGSKAAMSRVGPPGASVYQQLRFLGFSDAECDMASKRSLTLEAAMEWLANQQVTVHL